MFEFKHPKYYKELRKLRNKEAQRVPGCLPTNELHNSDQAISKELATAGNQRSPGPGLKQQAIEETVPHNDIEEAQATETQASSSKR